MEDKMTKKEQGSESFQEFLSEYNTVEIPKGKHINSSKYTLEQQSKRFNKTSHTKEECENILKEARSL